MGDGEHLGHTEGDASAKQVLDVHPEDEKKETGGGGGGGGEDSKDTSGLLDGDEKPQVITPINKYTVWPYTWWVIAAIWVLFFIISLGVNNCPRQTDRLKECELRWLGVFSFNPIRQNPLCGPGPRALVNLGALDPRRTSRKNEEWRVLTCLLLHAGLIHLLVNVPTTMFVGARLEREYGTLRMLLIFFVSAIGGALWSALLLVPNNIAVGASFPLFGLIGCTVADMSINGGLYVNKAVASAVLFFVAFIHIVFGLLPFVDNWGQIGAFLTGFILALLVLIKPRCKYEKDEPPEVKCGIDLRTKMKLRPWEEVVRVSALLALGAGFIFMIVALFSGADWKKDCDWCRQLNCADAPGWDCPRYQRLQPENTYKKVTCFVREVEATGKGTLVCPDGRMVDIGTVKERSRETLRLVCSRACRAW